jgi:hypothetical protein
MIQFMLQFFFHVYLFLYAETDEPKVKHSENFVIDDNIVRRVRIVEAKARAHNVFRNKVQIDARKGIRVQVLIYLYCFDSFE